MAYANKVLQMQRLAEAQKADASPAPTAKPVEKVVPASKPAKQKKSSRKAKK